MAIDSPYIRWMIRADMPQVLAIERLCFEYPWSKDDFINMCQRHAGIAMVATPSKQESDTVIGYMVYELFKTRMEVKNFAVAPKDQRKGVGTAMLDKLILKLSHNRRQRLQLMIRESNLDAQLFFAHRGFRCISLLPMAYEENDEAGYLFQFHVRQRKEIDPLPVCDAHPQKGAERE